MLKKAISLIVGAACLVSMSSAFAATYDGTTTTYESDGTIQVDSTVTGTTGEVATYLVYSGKEGENNDTLAEDGSAAENALTLAQESYEVTVKNGDATWATIASVPVNNRYGWFKIPYNVGNEGIIKSVSIGNTSLTNEQWMTGVDTLYLASTVAIENGTVISITTDDAANTAETTSMTYLTAADDVDATDLAEGKSYDSVVMVGKVTGDVKEFGMIVGNSEETVEGYIAGTAFENVQKLSALGKDASGLYGIRLYDETNFEGIDKLYAIAYYVDKNDNTQVADWGQYVTVTGVQSLTVEGAEVSVSDADKTISVDVPLYVAKTGEAVASKLSTTVITGGGVENVTLGSTSLTSGVAVDVDWTAMAGQTLTVGNTAYTVSVSRSLSDDFDNNTVFDSSVVFDAGNTTGTTCTNRTMVKGAAAKAIYTVKKFNLGANHITEGLSIGVTTGAAKKIDGTPKDAGQSSGNALYVRKVTGENVGNANQGAAQVMVGNMTGLDTATDFVLEFDIAYDYTGANKGVYIGTTGGGMRINGKSQFNLYSKSVGNTASTDLSKISDASDYFRMGMKLDTKGKVVFSTADGNSGRPTAATDSWHRIKIVGSGGDTTNAQYAKVYVDGQYWTTVDLDDKTGASGKEESIGWLRTFDIRTSDRRALCVWLDNLSISYTLGTAAVAE